MFQEKLELEDNKRGERGCCSNFNIHLIERNLLYLSIYWLLSIYLSTGYLLSIYLYLISSSVYPLHLRNLLRRSQSPLFLSLSVECLCKLKQQCNGSISNNFNLQKGLFCLSLIGCNRLLSYPIRSLTKIHSGWLSIDTSLPIILKVNSSFKVFSLAQFLLGH